MSSVKGHTLSQKACVTNDGKVSTWYPDQFKRIEELVDVKKDEKLVTFQLIYIAIQKSAANTCFMIFQKLFQ